MLFAMLIIMTIWVEILKYTDNQKQNDFLE